MKIFEYFFTPVFFVMSLPGHFLCFTLSFLAEETPTVRSKRNIDTTKTPKGFH